MLCYVVIVSRVTLRYSSSMNNCDVLLVDLLLFFLIVTLAANNGST